MFRRFPRRNRGQQALQFVEEYPDFGQADTTRRVAGMDMTAEPGLRLIAAQHDAQAAAPDLRPAKISRQYGHPVARQDGVEHAIQVIETEAASQRKDNRLA